MSENLLPHSFYEKLYDLSITPYLPVIEKYEVSDGTLTDLFVKVTFAHFYFPHCDESFLKCIGSFMKDSHNYLGTKKPTITLSLYKENQFVGGTFVEDDTYY